jgi:hypothetical protein
VVSLSAEDWGRQLARGLSADRAIAVFSTPDLTLTWSNEAYLTLVDEPFRSAGALGHQLDELSPLSYATKSELLRHVATCGDPESEEDRVFSVEDGITLYRWSVHRVCPDRVIAVIDVEPRRPRIPSHSRIAGVAIG